MTIKWFTSDTHFGHAAVIKYCNRPFASVEEMDAELVARHNARVQPGDVCLWLGDCFLCPTPRVLELMGQLNGTKLLVRGNHDRASSAMSRLGFAVVMEHATLHVSGKIVRAFHRPYPGIASPEDYPDHRDPGCHVPRRYKGEYLMHGHVHAKWRREGNQIHVGVDAWDYGPASLQEIEALLAPGEQT